MRRTSMLGVMAVLAGTMAGGAATAKAADAPPQAAPVPVLGENVNGADAVDALGTRLPSTAAAAGMTPSELKSELLEDDDLWIDRTGSPVYVDQELADYPVGAGAEPQVEEGPYPYADTFQLHSKEGSSRTIYLDFDGGTVSGTGWNTSYTAGAPFNASAFDMDSNPASFSDAEKDAIQSVWQRVAEDYAPLDIDVTTEEPDASLITRADSNDTIYGTRVMITNTETIQGVCNCGGIAYLGVFDQAGSHASFQPAFVFTRSSQSPKFIAEATSHEVGHNLGLAHDGTASEGYYGGHANWAPIMGVGYSKPVTQWSKGEYKGANNKQDDFSVMAENGGRVREDDFGNDMFTADFLGATFPIEEDGRITTAADKDVFKFNAGTGNLTVTVTSAPTSPNLDVSIDLLNAKGKSILKPIVDPVSGGSGDTATGMGATLSTTVTTAGTYYVVLDGVANGGGSKGYTDYGSVGQYNIEIAASSPSGLVNILPTPKIVADKVVGVPGPITLTNSGSLDPDGRITGTSWNFGDNTSAGSGSSVSHTFSTAGSYTVTMTISDNSGGSATKTQTITAVPAVKVSSIAVNRSTDGGKLTATAVVRVVNPDGSAVADAAVGIEYTYGTKKTASAAKTNSEGYATMKGVTGSSGTVVTVKVTKVTVKPKAWNHALDTVQSGTVTL